MGFCGFGGSVWVMGGSLLDSGYLELSENIWFVWSKTSYIGDVTNGGRDGTTREDRAAQLLICETLFLAMFETLNFMFIHL